MISHSRAKKKFYCIQLLENFYLKFMCLNVFHSTHQSCSNLVHKKVHKNQPPSPEGNSIVLSLNVLQFVVLSSETKRMFYNSEKNWEQSISIGFWMKGRWRKDSFQKVFNKQRRNMMNVSGILNLRRYLFTRNFFSEESHSKESPSKENFFRGIFLPIFYIHIFF